MTHKHPHLLCPCTECRAHLTEWRAIGAQHAQATMHAKGCECIDCQPRLHITTRDSVVSVEFHCDQTMTCACRRCSMQRARIAKQPEPAQPWQPRPARRAA